MPVLLFLSSPDTERSTAIPGDAWKIVVLKLKRMIAGEQPMDLQFVPCPRCRKRVRVGEKHFPFCSDRCRLLDLGNWFAEDYRVSRPAPGSLLDEEDLEGDGYDRT